MRLSPIQQKLLIGYLFCMLISCIYVPWEAGPLNPKALRIPAGYALIFNPPVFYEYSTTDYNPFAKETKTEKYHITGINYKILITEIAGITCFFGVIYLLTVNRNKNT
ncbi:hypothetical protein SOV_22450 [Sporomusa ovata DSM 2662]|uniref:Lipoprotein n=1 Tax=Sporomusa ovata TaxID=2378 RepID=A0A0U1L352_9FIRM|nr:hypothetical protein [Sporomusa ovata]EQB25561.1 hypothetical protein SOV_4c02240 [Sporomusa ovata DSM 2662]CQR74121.1 hypothetical protein SpAn4DRAFT_0583 [Sporomusa ovata]